MKSLLHLAHALLLSVGVLLASTAGANPKALPFSYGYPTQPVGALELEQYVDAVPVRVARERPDGTREAVTSARYDLQTELEYGLSDRAELGLYLVFRQGASADTPFLRFQGTKQRLRLRLAERSAWPLDVGLYLEVAEFHDELELEEKLLLSRQLGRFSVVANLWVEQEWYFQTEEVKHVYNPTFGVTYEIHPSVIVGAEYWVRGRFDSSDEGGVDDDGGKTFMGTHHYAGPTLMLQRDGPWAALGVYARLDTLPAGAPTADPYGALWVRLLLGFEL